MRFNYDTSQTPGIPAVDVVISNPRVGSSKEVGLIDTGSAITIVPERLKSRLGLVKIGDMKIRSITGSVTLVSKHIVSITIGGVEFKRVRVATLDRDNAVVGRNLINLWTLTLFGKSQVGRIVPWSTDSREIFPWDD